MQPNHNLTRQNMKKANAADLPANKLLPICNKDQKGENKDPILIKTRT